jgi:hypothetical protein
MNTYYESNSAVWSMRRRFAILSMAACVALSGVVAGSGCGVRMGMEKIDDAKQAKKQVEKQRHELEKKLQEGAEERLAEEPSANLAFQHAPAFQASACRHFSILCSGLAVQRTECRMRSSILARVWESMEGTGVGVFGPIGARAGGGDRSARRVAGLSL